MGVKSGSQLLLDALVSSLLRLYFKQQVYINSSGMQCSSSLSLSPLHSCHSPSTSVFSFSFVFITLPILLLCLYSTHLLLILSLSSIPFISFSQFNLLSSTKNINSNRSSFPCVNSWPEWKPLMVRLTGHFALTSLFSNGFLLGVFFGRRDWFWLDRSSDQTHPDNT